FLEGSFHKYNGNNGYKTAISDELSWIQTFSHFTYIYSKKKAIVVDMQGINYFFTDPQLHTSYEANEIQFSIGNRNQE
ncbi:5558_t:CDS:1, partial [Gigaspora margarita]